MSAIPEPVKMGEVTFVQATVADLQRILIFVEAYYRLDRIPFRLRSVKTGLATLLRDPSLGRVWLIRSGEREAGYIVVTFGYDLEFGGHQATITELYIADEYRRIGLGRAALKLVEATCQNLGIGALELQVERRNKPAQAFYRKLGFKSHDRIPMSKSLENRKPWSRGISAV